MSPLTPLPFSFVRGVLTQDDRRDERHLEIAGALGIQDAVNQVQQEARACHQYLRAHVGAAQERLHTRR